MSLRVGVFAEPIIQQQAGIHQYTSQLIAALESYGSMEYTLYASQRLKCPLRQEIYPWLRHSLRSPLRWLQFGGRDLSNSIDCLIDPSHFGSMGMLNHPLRISVIHDLTPELFPKLHRSTTVWGHRLLMQKWIASSRMLIVPSKHTAKDLKEHYHPKRPIKVIYPGTDLSPVDDSSTFLPRASFFLMVGTQEPRKNHEKVIEAFEQLGHAGVELVIAGPQGWKINLEERIAKSSSSQRIHLLGKVSRNHLRDLYQHAIALVYPSTYEGFGFPVLESMSMGCPVITSELGAMKEVAKDAALLVDPDNSDQLALSMRSLLEEAHLREELKQRGQIRALDFSWRQFVAQLESSLLEEFSDSSLRGTSK